MVSRTGKSIYTFLANNRFESVGEPGLSPVSVLNVVISPLIGELEKVRKMIAVRGGEPYEQAFNALDKCRREVRAIVNQNQETLDKAPDLATESAASIEANNTHFSA